MAMAGARVAIERERETDDVGVFRFWYDNEHEKWCGPL